ncbi:hypothetical protein HCN44_000370 [Aphidius gifuensis]|uniref:Uncharacterized protein n=2 Tax=Aphidius gifuensis TaxID=684658 RepID=A0A834XRS3_APHGI|nr:uncharacterized protein LOC122855083 [Aphidius gifuensis]KAF7990565.1 hypothetical protein HCN44_000370 [Aphidius gifuensis]
MFEMRAASVGPLRAYKMSIQLRMNKNLTRLQNELRKTRKVINSSKPSKNQEINELQLTIESIQTMTQKLLDASDELSKLETAENVILKEKNTYEFKFEQKNDREKIKEEEDFIDVEYNEEEEELSVLKSNSSNPIKFDLNFD